MIFVIILAQAIVQTSEIQGYLASKGVNIQVQGVHLGSRQLGSQEAYFLSLKTALLGKRKNTIVLVDPFMQGNSEYMLGYTSRDFSMCVWNLANEKGQDRKAQSLACIAHELGHQKGLKHTTGCTTLMDEAVLACPNVAALGFTKEQLKSFS